MRSNSSSRWSLVLAVIAILAGTVPGATETPRPLKVMMITDMEGVDGIFDEDLQCVPWKSPRWEESRKLLNGEISAAVEGLFEGGATDIVVWDGHWSGENLSALDIHPKVRLLTGPGVSSAFELDPSYSAEIFIGQHARAGVEKGVLSHSESLEIQNIWVNDKPVGEIGIEAMHAGSFNIPVIMLAGDTAACQELHDLVSQAECAEVKSGVSRTGGFTLSHPAACALIREKARRAIERLAEFKPYKIAGPVEMKIEYTPLGTRAIRPWEGAEQLNDHTWVLRGKDYTDLYRKFLHF